MKYRIEEAVIIETVESEPHFSIETVVPERIDRPSKEKTFTFFDDLFDFFIDSFDIFGLFDDRKPTSEDPNPKTITEPEPEIAIVVETHERVVQEQYYFVYEVIE